MEQPVRNAKAKDAAETRPNGRRHAATSSKQEPGSVDASLHKAMSAYVVVAFTGMTGWILGTRQGQFLLGLGMGLLLLVLGAFCWYLTGGTKHFGTDLNDTFWLSWGLFISPKTQNIEEYFSPHDPGVVRLVTALFSLTGFWFNLTVLGMVVEVVHEALDYCTEVYGRIDASGHILILGWGDKTLWLISELLSSAKYAKPERHFFCFWRRRNPQIVILADRSVVSMSRTIQMHLLFAGLSSGSIRYRHGDPAEPGELMKVSVKKARRILITGSSGNERRSDEKIIQKLLSLAALPGMSSLKGRVFAEIRAHHNSHVVRTILPVAEGIMPRYTVNRMLVLRAVVPSVGFAYLDSVSFRKGDEFYITEAPPELVGTAFRSACRCFPGAVVCAVVPAAASPVQKNPELVMDLGRKLQAGDRLLLLAASSEAGGVWHREAMEELPTSPTWRAAHPPAIGHVAEMPQPDGQLQLGPRAVGKKVVIMIGCPHDFANILQALDEYLAEGSEVHVLSARALPWRQEHFQRYFEPTGAEAAGSHLQRLTVHHHVGSPTSAGDLEMLPLDAADVALVLAEQGPLEDPVAVDSRSLTTAVLLRGLLTELRAARKCKVVTEMLDPESQQVLQRNNRVRACGSFVYTHSLAAALFTRAVAERPIYDMLLALLDPANHMGHIAAIAVSSVVQGTERLSYRELQARVWAARGGSLLGWRRANERYPVLNPKHKTEQVTWNSGDGHELIVLRPHVSDDAYTPSTTMTEPESFVPVCVLIAQ